MVENTFGGFVTDTEIEENIGTPTHSSEEEEPQHALQRKRKENVE
jgi:hypothetical protein